MYTDYLIIGQGISGSFLSKYLIDGGASVIVIDDANPYAASKVASGVINPVTGRVVATTWMADELMRFAKTAYADAGLIAGEKIITEKNILAFASTDQMVGAYDKRLRLENPFVASITDTSSLKNIFEFYYGVYEISPVLLVNLHPFLNAWRNTIKAVNALVEESFDEAELLINDDSIAYKNITAKKIIYCNGTGAYNSKYWRNLPYVLIKGEALVVDIPDLSTDKIYKCGTLTLVPWYNNLWWAGSNYENDFTNINPTENFYNRTKSNLQNALKIPFTITDHIASVRPGCLERRPFGGLHPAQKNIGILDGMGTKGCSLAPYFAKQLANFLLNNGPLQADVDVQRFSRSIMRD